MADPNDPARPHLPFTGAIRKRLDCPGQPIQVDTNQQTFRTGQRIRAYAHPYPPQNYYPDYARFPPPPFQYIEPVTPNPPWSAQTYGYHQYPPRIPSPPPGYQKLVTVTYVPIPPPEPHHQLPPSSSPPLVSPPYYSYNPSESLPQHTMPPVTVTPPPPPMYSYQTSQPAGLAYYTPPPSPAPIPPKAASPLRFPDLPEYERWLLGRGRARLVPSPVEEFEGPTAHVGIRLNPPAPRGGRTCNWCGNLHTIMQCPDLLSRSPAEREALRLKEERCENCLGTHEFIHCRSLKTCGIRGCAQYHNTLLHPDPGGIPRQPQFAGIANRQASPERNELPVSRPPPVEGRREVRPHPNTTHERIPVKQEPAEVLDDWGCVVPQSVAPQISPPQKPVPKKSYARGRWMRSTRPLSESPADLLAEIRSTFRASTSPTPSEQLHLDVDSERLLRRSPIPTPEEQFADAEIEETLADFCAPPSPRSSRVTFASGVRPELDLPAHDSDVLEVNASSTDLDLRLPNDEVRKPGPLMRDFRIPKLGARRTSF